MCNQEIFTKWEGCLEKSPVNEMLPSVGYKFWQSISQQWNVTFPSDYYRSFLRVISTNWYKNINHLNFALCLNLHNQLPPQTSCLVTCTAVANSWCKNSLASHSTKAARTDLYVKSQLGWRHPVVSSDQTGDVIHSGVGALSVLLCYVTSRDETGHWILSVWGLQKWQGPQAQEIIDLLGCKCYWNYFSIYELSIRCTINPTPN